MDGTFLLRLINLLASVGEALSLSHSTVGEYSAQEEHVVVLAGGSAAVSIDHWSITHQGFV